MLGPKLLLEKIIWNQWSKENLNKFKSQSNLPLKRKEWDLKFYLQHLLLNSNKSKMTRHQSLIEKRKAKIWKSYSKLHKSRIFINYLTAKWFSNTDHLIERADKILKMFINIVKSREKVEISITNEIIVVGRTKIFKELNQSNLPKFKIYQNNKPTNIMKKATFLIKMNSSTVLFKIKSLRPQNRIMQLL